MEEESERQKRRSKDTREKQKKAAEKESKVEKNKSDDECEEENEKVDDNTLIMEKKLIEDDLMAKFERYTELTKNILDYNEQEQNLTPAELKDPEEIKQIHDKFYIDFNPDQVTKIIKRGREELNTKRIEYTGKKEELEAKWRFLREEDKEVKQKIDSHQELVKRVDEFKTELVQSQAEIIDLKANCDTDKVKFATKYAEYKQDINELKNIDKKVNTRMAKQKGIVDTCNELITNYRTQNKEENIDSKVKLKEENKEEKTLLDKKADSICKHSSKVRTDCDTVKTSVTKMITDKNKEIQNAKNYSDKEKTNVDQNIEGFNDSKDEAKVSLETISKKVETIAKDIKDCNETSLEKRTDSTYDYTKLILEPIESIKAKDHDLQKPEFSFEEINKAKQFSETEFEALTEVQSNLRKLMLLGEEDSKVRVKMQEIQSQNESTGKTIEELNKKINELNNNLKTKKEEKKELEAKILESEDEILSTYKNNLNKVLKSEEKRLREREDKREEKNNDLIKK